MVSFDSKSYSKKLLHLISWSHWFTFFNIIVAILLSTVYLINEASPETFAGQVYLITTWLSHMAFLTFITFVLTVFPLTLLIPRTRFIRAVASIMFTVGMLLLLLDAFIYNRLGYHINASSASQVIDLIAEEIKHDRRSFWFVSLILALIILTFELTVSNYVWKHLHRLRKTVFARFVVIGLVSSFFISHLTHIWADANLQYDVLKQDSILPMSYPSTAKTLLTKYGLFNQEDYIERKTSPLTFSNKVPDYPVLAGQCPATLVNRSTFIVLTKQNLTNRQLAQFSQRSSESALLFNHHVDNALFSDAWFNLFYALPNIYQQEVMSQGTEPLLFQALDKAQLAKTFTVIGVKPDDDNLKQFIDMTQSKQLADIRSLIFPKELNALSTGLHVVYFSNGSSYQFELFMDALLLAQRQKEHKDNIWISSIGNESQQAGLAIKPAMLIWPESKGKINNHLTSHMDLAPTLLSQWLGCHESLMNYASGTDLTKLNNDRVIANTIEGGMMVFNKDKSVFIDQNGSFQSYSRQLEAPIMVSSDFPLMIDGVHFIKRYSNAQEERKQ